MKLYVYGNCQATALGRMILEQSPDWSVSSLDVSTLSPVVTEEEVARHLGAVEAADVVVSQPVGDFRHEPQLSLQTLQAAMRAGAQLITFPSIVFEATQGAFAYLDNRLDGYRMPYHNSHTVDMFLRGYSWRDIALLQSSVDFYSRSFVEGGIEASLALLREREALHATTIKVSPIIDERCRSTLLMHAVNHPRRVLLARVLDAIYRVMSVNRTAREAGEDHLRYPTIPPLPTVLHHLGFADEAPHVRMPDRSWTREEYTRESLQYYSRLLRPDLMRALAQSRGAAFLRSFHEAELSRDGPGSDVLPSTAEAFTEAVVADVFHVMLGRPVTPPELEAHTLSLQAGGLRAWLAWITAAEEFNLRFRRVDGPA